MRLALSSLLACLVLPFGGAQADGLAPCAGVSLDWTCENGAPVAQITRGARDDPSLTYRVLSAGRVTPMPPELTAVNFSAGGPITVVGLPPDDGPCCLSQRSLPAPPAGLCSTVPNPDPVPDTDPKPPQAPLDFAITLDTRTPCPPGAAGHLCRGAIAVMQTQGPDADTIVPLNVRATGAPDLDVTVTGAGCFGAGPGAQFCQLAPSPTRRTDLPMTLRAPVSFRARTITLCATLAPPDDPRAQIRLVQTALQSLGFDPGDIDGHEGPATLEAVAQLAQALKLTAVNSATDPAFLTALGLGPFSDADTANNTACATLNLPAITCPRGTTLQGGRCVAKLGGGGSGTTTKTDPIPAQCDLASTVLRNGACVCRYDGMRRKTASACVCRNGSAPVAGAGCP